MLVAVVVSGMVTETFSGGCVGLVLGTIAGSIATGLRRTLAERGEGVEMVSLLEV